MFGNAAKLRQVVRQCAVPLQHAIYVGDEIRDAEAVGKAGIAFGAVLGWGQHSQTVLRAQSPAEIFTSPQEIADKLC
jgi:phosphoglycolate phosphatase